MDIWFWVVVIVAAALVALVIVGRRSARSRVDPTQVSIDAALAGRVRELYAKGDRLKAVKELREATGLQLADAIRIADKLGAGAKKGQPSPTLDKTAKLYDSNIGPDNEAAIRSLLADGNKIGAIKLLRELTGMGLEDAKRSIDSMARE